MERRNKLYKLVAKKGIICPNPKNYPKRFDLYVKTHRLNIEDFEESGVRTHYIIGALCIMLMLSILGF